MNPVVVGVGLVTVVIATVVAVCAFVYFLIHLWNEGKRDGTSWRLGVVLFIAFAIVKACLSKQP